MIEIVTNETTVEVLDTPTTIDFGTAINLDLITGETTTVEIIPIGPQGPAGSGGGGGGVTSWNTRTGVVVPAANDYSFSQLSGTASLAQLPQGTNSQLLIALTGSPPAWRTVTGDVLIGTTGATLIPNDTIHSYHILDGAVQYARMQNVSASSKLLGSNATGSGAPPSEITLGTNLSMSGSTLNAASGTTQTRAVTLICDGSGSALSTGTKNPIKIPYGGTLTGWLLIGTPSGSVTVDILRAADGAGLPVTSIVGAGTKPALSSAVENSATSFTSWTSTTLTAKDNLAISLSGITSTTYVALTLYFS